MGRVRVGFGGGVCNAILALQWSLLVIADWHTNSVVARLAGGQFTSQEKPISPTFMFKPIRYCLSATVLVMSLAAYGQQSPMQGGFPAAPDSWLISIGQPWHHKTGVSASPQALQARTPSDAETAVVKSAQRVFESSSAKAMALVKGNEVVWISYKPPVTATSPLFGFSMGKTVTAMAVGQALCEGKLKLDARVADHVKELVDTDLGAGTVADLLTMRSGTWEGNPDSTIWTADEARAIGAGQLNWVQLLATPRVSTAVTGVFSTTKRKPGEKFSYRSTDPLTLGVMIARSTGKTYAEWVDEKVLMPTGIAAPAYVAQDRAARYGQGDAAIRMNFDDWIRFAVWVKKSETEPGCFGDFVRESVRSQAQTSRRPASSYGHLTWVEGDISWAAGHGGQRIGWNRRNDRMLVVFSSLENYSRELESLYAEWSAVP